MSLPEESETTPPPRRDLSDEEDRLALRRITQRLKQLRSEFENINQQGTPRRKDRERP